MKIYLYFGKKDKDLIKFKTAIKYWAKGRMVTVVNDMLTAYRNGEDYIFPLQYDNEPVSNETYRIPLEIKKENEGILRELNHYEINSFVKDIMRFYLRVNTTEKNIKEAMINIKCASIIGDVESTRIKLHNNGKTHIDTEEKIAHQTDIFEDNLILLSGVDEY